MGSVSSPSQMEVDSIVWESPSRLTDNLGGLLDHGEAELEDVQSYEIRIPWKSYNDNSSDSVSVDTSKEVSYDSLR